MRGSRRQPAQRLRRWHRLTGLCAAVFLLFLTVTGLPLQFPAELDLGNRFISSTWLLDWYGLRADGAVLGDGNVTSFDNMLYIDGAPPIPLDGLRGSIKMADLLVVAGESELLLLSPDSGAVVDRIAQPDGIVRIGTSTEGIVIQTMSGYIGADAELVNFPALPTQPDHTQWLTVAPLPELAANAYRNRARARLLTAERLLQDLHSGRLFGTVGVLVVNVAGVCLLFLVLSGLLMQRRRPRRRYLPPLHHPRSGHQHPQPSTGIDDGHGDG
ncbi:MAG: PepSY domain-containing protein [Pseudomonadales bacterium]|nr:PepSY domain-containing protein [Pseudomonadales bacterium]